MTGPALEVDGVRKRYGRRQAVADMTFDIRAGELFGFVGSNGAGKTTTMRIILGVLTPDEGEVRWRGHPVGLGHW
ncbi:ATP-binding cassette domain-containing protein [Streptomyces sp. NPDC050164]|uniref:ATP-binding cassette domain-containing protein n=1 Tax=Streptomyces sp. NPDC050164 TaxID=3365605 RepID=UPI00379DBEA2